MTLSKPADPTETGFYAASTASMTQMPSRCPKITQTTFAIQILAGLKRRYV